MNTSREQSNRSLSKSRGHSYRDLVMQEIGKEWDINKPHHCFRHWPELYTSIEGLEAGGLSSKQRKLYVMEVKRQNQAQKRKFDDADWKNQPITCTPTDFDIVVTPHNDPLVTSFIINNCERHDGPIYGFNNQPVQVEGVLTLNVVFGSGRIYVTPSVWFLVVKMAFSFNVVIGRPTLTEIRAMVSQSHLCMKFLTPMGIATLRDMLGIPTLVSQHKLSTNPLKKPIAQKRCLFGGERLQVIKEEVEKLLQAGFVKRVDYCEWVANPVLVKKANAAFGNERLSLLDTYSGYHQVPMAPEDEEKTSFYTAQIGRNLEVYVDDIVVKSPKAEDHLADLDETLNNLRKNRMREHALKFNFDTTNNMAEYEALLLSLQLALELKVMAIQVYSDSQLVINQVNSLCEVVDSVMMKSVFVEVLDEQSFMKPRMIEISTDPNTPSWTDPIVSFLRDGLVLEDKQEEMRLRKKASRYTLVDGVLYKRFFSLPLLQCLNPYNAKYALREVHEGVCGSHIGARTLAHKVHRQGYYWPNIYGIPNQIVANNGTQFNCSSFRDFYSSYGIKLQFTSVYHPESNGMVEFVNKVILEGIKSRLEQHKARWANELNNVLWAYRTMSQTATALNWEGPYTVVKVPHPSPYIFQDVDGKRIPRVWNINNLKKFYP
ncbi:hypothetical protein SLEP1_g18868 [Rubroshorea leprosula]|uniref:Integrase catalytic domain-containing protein n=1 Tax=Rubroshorea leprosula TaxID=152421 RepID=A0AAV5J2E8_9ROSI|nr:hypothetical protein SLEP1_g18868 [Rubroshorea leprosula]